MSKQPPKTPFIPNPSVTTQPIQPQSAAVIRVEERTQTIDFRGPLPPPEVLGLYEQVVPGVATAIVNQFTEQGNHRRACEKLELDADIHIAQRADGHVRRGQWLGFVIILTMLASGTWTIHAGHDLAGSAVVVTGIASVIAAFLKRDSQRDSKHPDQSN